MLIIFPLPVSILFSYLCSPHPPDYFPRQRKSHLYMCQLSFYSLVTTKLLQKQTNKQEKPRVFSHCSLKFSNYTNISAFHIVLETLLLIDRVMILSIDDADFLALSAVWNSRAPEAQLSHHSFFFLLLWGRKKRKWSRFQVLNIKIYDHYSFMG